MIYDYEEAARIDALLREEFNNISHKWTEFPKCVWFRTANGYARRPATKADMERRVRTAAKLI